eukprot:3666-Heterococcus_DN1.PRE.2
MGCSLVAALKIATVISRNSSFLKSCSACSQLLTWTANHQLLAASLSASCISAALKEGTIFWVFVRLDHLHVLADQRAF